MSIQAEEDLKLLVNSKCFGGRQRVYEHSSKECNCRMKFAIFLPSEATKDDATQKFPVVYYLSGLGNDEQTFITRSGFQRYAEENKLIVVCCDTSPRGCNIPGEEDDYNFGTGAGFYCDSTEEPWSGHYRMYSYVTQELRKLIETTFSQVVDSRRRGLIGFSMGGHGALVLFLRNPDLYQTVTAIAPVAHTTKSPWAIKLMRGYLGSNEESWKEYDATELVKRQPNRKAKIYMTVGLDDKYYNTELMTREFAEACKEAGQPLDYEEHEEYAHDYFYLSTIIGKVLRRTAETLRG